MPQGSRVLQDLQYTTCIANNRRDLEAVPDDARIPEQSLDIGVRVAHDPLGIVIIEGLPVAVALALAQDGEPAQTGLRPCGS